MMESIALVDLDIANDHACRDRRRPKSGGIEAPAIHGRLFIKARRHGGRRDKVIARDEYEMN